MIEKRSIPRIDLADNQILQEISQSVNFIY